MTSFINSQSLQTQLEANVKVQQSETCSGTCQNCEQCDLVGTHVVVFPISYKQQVSCLNFLVPFNL